MSIVKKSTKNTMNKKEKSSVKVPKRERMLRIKAIGQTVGLWNVKRGEISREHGVSERTTYQDIQDIFKAGIDPESLQHAKVNIDNLNKAILTRLQEALYHADGKDLAKLADTLLHLQTKHTDYLERYGVKDATPTPTDNHITVHWRESKKENDDDDDVLSQAEKSVNDLKEGKFKRLA